MRMVNEIQYIIQVLEKKIFLSLLIYMITSKRIIQIIK